MNKIILLLSFVLAFAFNVSAETQTERERIYARTVGKEDANFRRYVRLNNSLRSMKKGLASSEKRLAEGNFKTPKWYMFQETLPQKVERLKEEIAELQAKVDKTLAKNAKLVATIYADYKATE